MSIEVHIPLRLSIDRSLSRRAIGAEVNQAVGAAVHRAVAEMDREMIAPRGGYAWPRFNAPEFSWTASDRPIDADWRGEIERELTTPVSVDGPPYIVLWRKWIAR